jgi:pimeloyl-ACP methyl ester carboxylesterase
VTKADDTSADTPVPRPEPTGFAAGLAYDRQGKGEPLVLLHGHGLSRRSWDPVLADLAAKRDVIAVDLPGHGDSPRQPEGRGYAPADLALTVGDLLDELGLATAHIVGNSTGGWVALELGRLGRATTVTALSPAGLWRRSAPAHIRAAMRQSRANARLIRRATPDAPQHRLSKALMIGQATGHPFQVPDDVVRTAVHDMATAPGFRETLRGAERRSFRDGTDISVPVIVAFGSRDRVLLPLVARRRSQLPPQTRWLKLPGCGHIPMFENPRMVTALLLEATQPGGARADLAEVLP